MLKVRDVDDYSIAARYNDLLRSEDHFHLPQYLTADRRVEYALVALSE